MSTRTQKHQSGTSRTSRTAKGKRAGTAAARNRPASLRVVNAAREASPVSGHVGPLLPSGEPWVPKYDFVRLDAIFADRPAIYLLLNPRDVIMGIFAIPETFATPDMEGGLAQAYISAFLAKLGSNTETPPVRAVRG